MKKLNKEWERKYRPLKLYKDDLIDIINIAKEGYEKTNPDFHRHLVIQVDEFEIEETVDLDDIEKEVVNIFYVYLNFSPVLRLRLEKYSASLLVTDDKDTWLMGVASKIDSILQKKQRRFSMLFSHARIGLIIFGMLLLLFCLYCLAAWNIIPSYPVLIIGVIHIYVMWKVGDIKPNYSTIIMSNSNEVPSFYKRHKDKILLTIVVSIISSSISVLGTLLVQWITKKP